MRESALRQHNVTPYLGFKNITRSNGQHNKIRISTKTVMNYRANEPKTQTFLAASAASRSLAMARASSRTSWRDLLHLSE